MISTLKELEQLIKLCRKQGITEIDLHGVSFKLGESPERGRSKRKDAPLLEEGDPYKNFPSGELTPDQLMFYSAGGMPENDPVSKVS